MRLEPVENRSVQDGHTENHGMREGQIEKRDREPTLVYMTQNDVGLPVVWNYFQNAWNDFPFRLKHVF